MTRKDEILEAARRCFAKHGFAKTTMDDVAQAVGMKAGSLYHYYDSKDIMFRDVIAHEGEEMLRWLEGEMGKVKSPVKKILRYTQARLEYFRKAANLLDVSIQVAIEVLPLADKLLYENFHNREIDVLGGFIREGVETGHFIKCNDRDIASTILTISDAVKFKAFRSADTMSSSDVDYSSVDTEVSYIVNLILAGLTKSK